MTGLPAVLALGFGLGLRHAADSDHVAAVGALAGRRRRFGSAWLLGLAWGVGHGATLMTVGAAIILCGLVVAPRVGLFLEFLVGMALVALGARSLSGAGPLFASKHVHEHDHSDPAHCHAHGGGHDGSRPHGHVHTHPGALERLRALSREAGPGALLRCLAVGLLHGLAGSAAAALLVLATIPEPRLAVLYLAVFAAGTAAGMLVLSAAMELSLSRIAFPRLAPAATGLLSVCVGLWVMWQTAFPR